MYTAVQKPGVGKIFIIFFSIIIIIIFYFFVYILMITYPLVITMSEFIKNIVKNSNTVKYYYNFTI